MLNILILIFIYLISMKLQIFAEQIFVDYFDDKVIHLIAFKIGLRFELIIENIPKIIE